MDVEQERQAIKNAKVIKVMVDGVALTATKKQATMLIFERQKWTIEVVSNTIIVLHKS